MRIIKTYWKAFKGPKELMPWHKKDEKAFYAELSCFYKDTKLLELDTEYNTPFAIYKTVLCKTS